MFLQPPKAESPGRLRLAALESGFSSFRTEIASMFASLTGHQIPKLAGHVYKTGVLTVVRFFPHGNWRTPLLANGPNSTDTTLTAQQGAALTSSYRSDGTWGYPHGSGNGETNFLSGHRPEQPGLGPIGANPATVERGYTPRGTAALHPGD